MKRALVESLERRKDGMIQALWSNSNYDDDKDTRTKAIEEIEENYDEAASKILTGWVPEPEEDIEENPFFAPARKKLKELEQPRNDEGNVADVVGDEYSKYVDQ